MFQGPLFASTITEVSLVKRIRPTLIVTAALLAATACAQTPTSSASAGSARHDGGNTLGSGGAVPVDTTQRGGNTMGSGS